MTPPPTTAPVLFLDMNAWVAIARGVKSGAEEWIEAAHSLRRLTESDNLAVPLIGAHYLELWHRRGQESREDVGRQMRDISAYKTFAPLLAVQKLELDAYLGRIRGRESRVAPIDVLGVGANHAFDSRFGRFRFVASIAAADGSVPEGPAVPAPDELAKADLSGPAWEWYQLVGEDELLDMPGLERTPEHRLGTLSLDEEQHIRDLLTSQPWARQRLRDLIITREVERLTTAIHQACWEHRIDPRSLLFENPNATPPQAMQALVNGMPSLDTLVTLRERKHQDLGHRWDQHDRTDLHALAVAIPYSKIVITEKRWAHMARASGLAERYDTEIYGLSDLRRVVQGLTELTA